MKSQAKLFIFGGVATLVVFALAFIPALMQQADLSGLGQALLKFSGPLTIHARIIRDVPYVPGSNNPNHTLDLYLPYSARKLPVIVVIHGGRAGMLAPNNGPRGEPLPDW